jgi:DNA-binding winged helix-turn-helix (wHTH) protein/tetratricopeptide (TPR) repeat protein
MLWRFQDFELDGIRFELRRGGKRVAIAPKPLALLLHLAKRHPASVSRDELLRVLWRGVHVTEDSLSRAVYLARRTIGAGADDEGAIRTVRGRGYAFGPTIRPVAEGMPRVGPARGTPLVGRAAELEVLDRALAAAVGGRGSVVLLSGEPGIGKTRLAEELAARTTHAGALALWGRCWETGGAQAFWPWTQVLRGYAHEAGRKELRAALGPAKDRIGPFIPELYGELGEAAVPRSVPALDTEDARFVLFDAATGFLARAAGRRPLGLLLDDLHAADLPSMLLLRFLARGLHELPLLIVATHREAELRRRPDAARVIADLARSGVSLPLRGLGDTDVRHFLAAGFDVELDPRSITTLQAMTGGNPFLVGEVARGLAAQPGIDPLARLARETLLPALARDLIRRRLDLLSPRSREILRAAALVGQEFGLRMLREISRLPDSEVLDRLREASDDGLVVAVAPAGMRYRFQHALTRETLADEVQSADRLALHLRIGEAIEALHGPHLDAYLSALAHHFVRAAAGGGSERAVRYAQAAGERDLAMLAYEEAATHFEAALEALEFAEQSDVERRCQLLIALGTCRQKAADLDGARRVLDEASMLARSLGRSDLLGRAALAYAPWTSYGRPGSAAAHRLEEALAALPRADSPLRAELLARLAHILESTGARAPRPRVIALGREAIHMARRLGDDRSLARALFVGRWTDWDPASFVERTGMTAELLAIAARLGDRELEVLGEGWRAVDCLERGDPVEADAALCRHGALASELRQPEHLWWNTVWRGTCAVMEGRHADAEELLARAAAIGERVDRENAFLVAWVQRSQIMADRGELEQPLLELDAIVAERRETLEGDPYPSCRRVEALVELGRVAEVRSRLGRLVSNDFAALPLDMRYGINLASLAVACAALGDAPLAAALYERLLPAAGRNLVFGPGLVSAGPAARYQGLLAATMGRHDLAQRHLDDALAASRRMGWLPLVARTQCDRAEALLRRGRRQDTSAAERLLDEAIETAERLGLAGIEQRARALRARRERSLRATGLT